MINKGPDELTADVLATMERTPNPRLREIMTALASHLHAFVQETRLTEEEFRDTTALMAEMGTLTNDRHNEFVLMAGSLGVSALVCLLNNGADGSTETTQNLLGPFWRLNSPKCENGASIERSPTTGAPMFVTLSVTDRDGTPIPGVIVDIWHSNADGLYENQDESQVDMNLRGTFTTDARGKIWFRSVKPNGYPIPTDGVVGRLLAAQQRHPYRPAHIHALGFKPGYKTLITQIYADDDPRVHTDAQFGVTRALLGHFTRHDEPHRDTPSIFPPWYSLEHSLVMLQGEANLPRAPIK